jgi:hypothetical protein
MKFKSNKKENSFGYIENQNKPFITKFKLINIVRFFMAIKTDSILGRLKYVLFGSKSGEVPKVDSPVIEKPIISSISDLYEPVEKIADCKLKYINRDPEPKKEYVMDIFNKSKKPLSITEIITKGDKFSHVTIRRYVKILEEEGKIVRDPYSKRYSLVDLMKGK